MKKAEKPKNEKERLAELLSYEVMDTPEELAYDDITAIAASICEVPIALVSLLDGERQWFKSHHGLEARETPRDISFCGHAIHQQKIFEVEDSRKDDRFHDNPLVTGAPEVIFYAGTPLQTPGGHNIGTLCVIDNKPKKLSEKQRQALEALGRQVVAQLELRKSFFQMQRHTDKIKKQAETIVSHQDEMVHNAKLVSLGFLAAGVAHEVNNPLCVVTMNAERIRLLASEKDVEKQKIIESCEKIKTVSLRITEIVASLRSLADQAQSGEKTIEPVKAIVEDALKICRRKFSNHGISITIDEQNNASILCHRGQICQVLINMLANAYEAVQGQQEKWVKILIGGDRDKAIISVTDSGSGVPDEIEENIMDPFFTTKDVGEGMGMGLSVSSNIMHSHEGAIKLDKSGDNTTFKLVFENKAAEPEPDTSKKAA